MYKQILVPNEHNATVTIPNELFGMEIVIMAYPIKVRQTNKKKQPAWLNGNSKIDNPVCIGGDFRKISRDEIYDRKSLY